MIMREKRRVPQENGPCRLEHRVARVSRPTGTGH
jgi:hypothetical protein